MLLVLPKCGLMMWLKNKIEMRCRISPQNPIKSTYPPSFSTTITSILLKIEPELESMYSSEDLQAHVDKCKNAKMRP